MRYGIRSLFLITACAAVGGLFLRLHDPWTRESERDAVRAIVALGGSVAEEERDGSLGTSVNFCHLRRAMTAVGADGHFVGPTDRDLAVLTRLKCVTSVNLCNCPISDRGLLVLEQLKSLRVVYLYNSGVSALGVDRLKRNLPRVEVYWDNDPIPEAEWWRAFLGREPANEVP
ncbi:MAG: hypothetical protein HYS13_17535 [Planctomycetia bacterium]|nr:hypothetical protein [Planctomycetia bacterium]